MPFLDSEAELAAVVAIELAHLSSHGNFFAAVGDHEWQAERTLGQVASSIASIGALFSPRAWMEGNPLSPAYPDEHGAIARAVTAARQGASRASELRAVTRATAYLAQAGYSTAALPAALHNLRRAKSPDYGPSTPALSTVNYHAERALGAQRFGVSAGDPGANLDAFSSAIRAGHKLFRERTNRGQRASDDSRHHPAQDHPRVGTVN